MTAMGASPRASRLNRRQLRIDVEGEGAETLLFHRGDGLRALQTMVNTAFRRSLATTARSLVDCQGFRRDKDAELRQMARSWVEKALPSGAAQEIGPLNSYERRIVHMAVAEIEGLTPKASATRRSRPSSSALAGRQHRSIDRAFRISISYSQYQST